MIGAAVGVPLGILAIAAVAWAFWERGKYKALERRYYGGYVDGAARVGSSEGARLVGSGKEGGSGGLGTMPLKQYKAPGNQPGELGTGYRNELFGVQRSELHGS